MTTAHGPTDWYAGVMSGTSLDGLDLVVADFSSTTPRVLAATTTPMPDTLRSTLLQLCYPGEDSVDLLGWADTELANLIADGINTLLAENRIRRSHITALGSHGQTIRHRPDGHNPFSLQIGDPNIIAERTGITVVADFRRRDLAAGGQGAPLVPAFHAALFSAQHARAVVNIGGMANLTLLPAERPDAAWGFDTGPGNVLLDAWAMRHTGRPMDPDGSWARQHRFDQALLERLLNDPYFSRTGPKSTGREQFHAGWLAPHLDHELDPGVVQATLTELTARTIGDSISRATPAQPPAEVLICGGGRHNSFLMERLAAALPHSTVSGSEQAGIDGDWIEAMAFAWLARRRLQGLSGNLPAVTGAAGRRILGAVYPGRPHGPGS